MRYSKTDLSVLRYVQLDTTISNKEAATALGLQERTVYRSLRKLTEDETIKLRPFLDTYKLGYQQFVIFFSLAATTKVKPEKIIQAFSNHSAVSALVEVGGEFNYQIVLTVRNIWELEVFLEWVGAQFGGLFQTKKTALQWSHAVFGLKCIGNKPCPVKEQIMKVTQEVTSIDELDHRILNAAMRLRGLVPARIARDLGQPASTIAYRINQLKDKGIIAASVYDVQSKPLGLQCYVLMIETSCFNRAFHESFHKFARQHKAVENLTHLIGSWDYHLGISVLEGGEANALSREIQDLFKENIRTVRVLPLFKTWYVRDYPFKMPATSDQD